MAAIISTTNVTGLLLRMTCITSFISITKKQIVYIHTESCVTAADSVSLSLFNIGTVLESKEKFMCSKGNQQWGKIMREMYHYGNREGINSILPVLKESKGLKNEITNLYLNMSSITVQAPLRQHKCWICSTTFAVAIWNVCLAMPSTSSPHHCPPYNSLTLHSQPI